MCNTKFRNSRTLEVVCSVANGITKLPPDDFLQSKKIIGISAYQVGQVAVGPETATALQADAAFIRSFLTLVKGSEEKISTTPFYNLNPANNGGLIRPIEIENFSLTKSYITCSAGDTAKIWLLEFFYEDK